VREVAEVKDPKLFMITFPPPLDDFNLRLLFYSQKRGGKPAVTWQLSSVISAIKKFKYTKLKRNNRVSFCLLPFPFYFILFSSRKIYLGRDCSRLVSDTFSITMAKVAQKKENTHTLDNKGKWGKYLRRANKREIRSQLLYME
jgi:hypothetical protein